MTRKDYILIAKALADAKAYGMAPEKVIANMLAVDNPRFDRARFIAACEVTA